GVGAADYPPASSTSELPSFSASSRQNAPCRTSSPADSWVVLGWTKGPASRAAHPSPLQLPSVPRPWPGAVLWLGASPRSRLPLPRAVSPDPRTGGNGPSGGLP